MNEKTAKYDIFISYSRDEFEWVKVNLYERLCRCRFRGTGRRPSVFFDKAMDGIGVGQDWREAISAAIEQSPRFVPVYSEHYFQSNMCDFELNIAQYFDLNFKQGRIYPLLFLRRGQEPASVERLIPLAVRFIHYLAVTEDDWFERLCVALDLMPESQPGVLAFLDQPIDVAVNHNLPPIRVAIKTEDTGELLTRDEDIRLSAEGAALQGTVTMLAKDGVARFADLSIGERAASVRLVARAEGLESARSREFAVRPVVAPRPPRAEPQIACPGEALFFDTGRALAVLHEEAVRVFDRSGRLLSTSAERPLRGRLRLLRRSGPDLVLADWSGNIALFADDGQSRTWSFGGGGVGGFVVPGDAALDGRSVLVGFWSGAVWRLSMDSEPECVLQHEPGVQALAVARGALHIVDFDGTLWAYKGDQRTGPDRLEASIRLLKPYPDGLLAIGDERAYFVQHSPRRVLDAPLPIKGVAAVLADPDAPLLINREGVGVFLTAQLLKRSWFRTAPGALPVCADRSGRYAVLENPDGSRTLLRQRRIDFTQMSGTLAVSPTGDCFALGEDAGIRILDEPSLLRLIQGEALDG